jgi:two-component system cell cycle sensor histidine kinase/response regulator CckA
MAVNAYRSLTGFALIFNAPFLMLQNGCMENEKTFQQLVESLPDAILVHRDLHIVYVNPACMKMLGAERPEQLIGKHVRETVHPDSRPDIESRIQACLETGESLPPNEHISVSLNGSLVYVEAVAAPILWKGKPAVEVVLRDISRTRLAEQSVGEWEKRLELAQKAGLRIGLWDWNLSTDTVAWSNETYRQFGLTGATFSGKVEDVVPLIHPEDLPVQAKKIADVRAGAPEYSAQYRVVRPDQSICWIDAHGVTVRNGSTHMLGICVDITSIKNAEQCYRESEQKYRQLFENAPYGIFRADPAGRLLDVNPALVQILGYGSKEELLECNLSTDIYENAAERESILKSCPPGSRVQGVEVRWKRKNGKRLIVRMSGMAIAKDDGSLRHYEVMVDDITERRTLEEQFLQAQKMEAVGRLAGGVAHDFNNALGIITGYSELLQLKLESNDPRSRQVAEILRAGRRAASLTRQLLAFSRKQPMKPVSLDMNAVVTETDKMLRRLIGENIDLVLLCDPQLGRTKADPVQVEQILMNLAVNAHDAMPNGGRLTIETGNATLAREDVARYPFLQPGNYVLLSVTDNGCGITPEVQSHLFEPFFTTKEPGKGTGLGLATVYGIVKQSGGYVLVDSQPGEGARFRIYLPRVEEVAHLHPAALQPRSKLPLGTETVLLVEDEPALRGVARACLESKGYNVMDAQDGTTALELANCFPGPIQLLLTDVILPDISGRALAETLAKSRSEFRVLYTSGYTDDILGENGVLNPGTVFLQKPFTIESLLLKVREVLDANSATAAAGA